MMVGRILIDVTEFLYTTRTQASLSGVPRSLVEVGTRLIADPDLDVVCFFYNQEAGEFYVVDSGILTVARNAADARRRTPGMARRVLDLVASSGRRMPLYRAARRALAGARRRRPMDFRPGDTVLLLGASWAPAAVIPALLERRRRTGFDLATVVYDTIPISHPQVHLPGFVSLYSDYLRAVLPLSRSVMAISRSAADGVESLARSDGIAVVEPRVVLLGDSTVEFADSRRPVGFPDGDFVLYVSTVEPRKNQMVLYQAFKQARLEGRALPRIVLVGRPGWLIEDFAYVLDHDPDVGDRILWLKSVTDAELGWLYRNTLFTLFPSIVEGWGLPIAESLAHGKFCITCNTSSMPEVGGDLVDYLSPWDTEGWASAISRYASDRDLLATRTERVRRDYRPRSWDDTAAAVSAALQLS